MPCKLLDQLHCTLLIDGGDYLIFIYYLLHFILIVLSDFPGPRKESMTI